MELNPEVLASVATAIATGSGVGNMWFWYDKKKGDKTVDDLKNKVENLAKQQIEHDNKFITEAQTRSLLQEYFAPLQKSWADTNSDVKDIKNNLMELTMQLRVINAVRDLEKDLNSKKD